MMVPVDAVRRVQPFDSTGAYLAGPSVSGDPYSHVVVDRGVWLLEDGHHRHQAAIAAGERFWPARVHVVRTTR